MPESFPAAGFFVARAIAHPLKMHPMNCVFSLVAFSAAALLAEQLSDLPLPDVGNVTATAILGWYAWYTASRTIPHLVKAFRDEMAASRLECRADREAFRSELADERHSRHADNRAVVEAIHELTARLPLREAPAAGPLPPADREGDR